MRTPTRSHRKRERWVHQRASRTCPSVLHMDVSCKLGEDTSPATQGSWERWCSPHTKTNKEKPSHTTMPLKISAAQLPASPHKTYMIKKECKKTGNLLVSRNWVIHFSSTRNFNAEWSSESYMGVWGVDCPWKQKVFPEIVQNGFGASFPERSSIVLFCIWVKHVASIRKLNAQWYSESYIVLEKITGGFLMRRGAEG